MGGVMGKRGSSASRPPSQPIQLHVSKISAPCRAVWLYLAQNNLPYEIKEVDLMAGGQKTEEFTKMNPHQKVPTIQDGSITVYESPAIVRYLAHRYCQGRGCGGKNFQDQVKIEQVLAWTLTGVYMESAYHFVYPQIFMEMTADHPMVVKGKESFVAHLDVLEKHYLAQNKFACGNEPTIADLFLAVFISLAEWVAFDFSSWPKVVEWFRQMKLQPHWKEVHEAHRAFAKMKSGVEPEQPEPPQPEPKPEEKPAEDNKEEEAKPAEEERDCEAKPAEDEEKPAEDEEKPAEPAEEAKPAEGEEPKPAESEESKPAEAEESKPAEGEESKSAE